MRFALLICLVLTLSGCLTEIGIVKSQNPSTTKSLTPQKAWLVGSLRKTPGPMSAQMRASLLFRNHGYLATRIPNDSDFKLFFDWETSPLAEAFGISAPLWGADAEATKREEIGYDSLFLMEVAPGPYYLSNISVYAYPYTTQALSDYYIPIEIESGTVNYLGALTMDALSSGRIRTAQVIVENQFVRDVEALRAYYPQLDGIPIKDNTLPVSYISPFVTRY